MTIKEAIPQRHMVRKFTGKPIPAELVQLLNARIAENNQLHKLVLKKATLYRTPEGELSVHIYPKLPK